jgi:hypothetical protein
VNTLTCNAENATRQPRYSPRLEDPLLGALIANAQLKLHLRRLRADAAGSHRRTAISRLLDVGESVDRSLSWLRGSPDEPCMPFISGPELDDLVPIAMEAQVSRAEAVAQ